MKMSEMCVDKRTGRKSARYAELREAERQRRRRKQLKSDPSEPSTPAPESAGLAPALEPGNLDDDDDDVLQPLMTGPRVVTDADGQIIVDPASLQVDRHAIHPSTLTDSLEHTTEGIFSSKTNSSTYASTRTHASNTVRWFPTDNERFYTALRMFGTDFGMIAMFLGGGKSRRHIKNKFDKEEKKNADKLTWALKNRIAVDVDALEEQRGTKLSGMDQLKEELAGMRAEAAAIMALPRLSQSAKATVDDNQEDS
jgi:transcription factor TFIIIB component B''